MPAVVLGLGITGLGVVRSLARHRVPVIGLDTTPRRAGAYTRLCRKVLVNSQRPGAVWDALLGLGCDRESERPVLFLTRDTDVLEASARREALAARFRFLLPDPAAVDILMDKVKFADFAREHRLPVPVTHRVRDGRGWERVLDEGPFPCVVKPKYRSEAWIRAGLRKAFIAEGADELRALMARLGRVEGDYVIQEWIPGADRDVHFWLAYYDREGRPVAGFAGRKLRQWPPLVGSTSVAEPSGLAGVEAEARRVLDPFGFRGLGSVEFKQDARDGALKIMEATVGRPNLQSEVAAVNGVDLAYVAYRNLIGLPPPPARAERRRVRWIFLDNDLSSALHYWRRGELTLGQFVASYRRPRYFADFSARDPGPFLAIASRIGRNALRRAAGRGSRPESEAESV